MTSIANQATPPGRMEIQHQESQPVITWRRMEQQQQGARQLTKAS